MAVQVPHAIHEQLHALLQPLPAPARHRQLHAGPVRPPNEAQEGEIERSPVLEGDILSPNLTTRHWEILYWVLGIQYWLDWTLAFVY